MASNKKTENPCFGTATEAAIWQKRNCQNCEKLTVYNKRLRKMPRYNCAVQRDIELQQFGIKEISERSYLATLDRICPYIRRNDGDVEVRHKQKHEPTKILPQSDHAPINIVKEAERMREERLEQERQEKRNKDIDKALAKAYDRRMNRNAIVSSKKKQVTPELVSIFTEKGQRIKEELDDVVRLNLSAYHILIRSILDIGDGIMQDAIRDIKARNMYRHELKKRVNSTVRAYERVTRTLEIVTRDVSELRNIVLDRISDEVSGDITKLIYAIKSVLDRHGIKDSMMIARIDAAWTIFRTAVMEAEIIYMQALSMSYDVFKRNGIKPVDSFREEFDTFFVGKRPDAIPKEWDKVAQMVCKYSQKISDEISDDTNFKNAVTIIQRKLSDAQHIEDMSAEIIEQNPHLVDEYKKRFPDWDKTIAV